MPAEELNQNIYYQWSKEFLEAGKQHLSGNTQLEATSVVVRSDHHLALCKTSIQIGFINFPVHQVLVTINAGSALGQHLLVLLFCLTRWPGISVAISTGNAVPTLHFSAMRWNEISHRQATGNNSARAVSRAWPHPKPPITQPAPGLLCPC